MVDTVTEERIIKTLAKLNKDHKAFICAAGTTPKPINSIKRHAKIPLERRVRGLIKWGIIQPAPYYVDKYSLTEFGKVIKNLILEDQKG